MRSPEKSLAIEAALRSLSWTASIFDIAASYAASALADLRTSATTATVTVPRTLSKTSIVSTRRNAMRGVDGSGFTRAAGSKPATAS